MSKDNIKKTKIAFIQAHSLRELLARINCHNVKHPDIPILKDDIVKIFKEEETFFLIYYI